MRGDAVRRSSAKGSGADESYDEASSLGTGTWLSAFEGLSQPTTRTATAATATGNMSHLAFKPIDNVSAGKLRQ